METGNMPTTDEWIKKMYYLYTMEFYSAQRIIKFCHSQVNGWNWRTSSQAKKAKNHRFFLICGL
jgi:hypothetical protein